MSNLKALLKVKLPKQSEWLRVSQITERYNVSSWSIYEAIRVDSMFPVKNLGKKNYRINPKEFEKWLCQKSKGKRYAYIPTAEECLGANDERN